MSYRVFARKYRPQQFSEIVGQGPIVQTLQNAITTGKLAQAYLFVGPRGIGKTSTARIFAKALNCHQGPTIHPCDVCAACLEIAEGRNLDVLEIDGASNNSVENIRTLRENAAFAPVRGPYKIYLIDEVHMLTTAAFNALLKTLEEPPPHVKFLFATTESQKLPATITSRCQRFELRRLSEKDIANHLLSIAEKEKIVLQPEASQILAHGADGALRDAESMLDQMVAFCGETVTAAEVQHVFGFTSRDIIEQLGKALLERDIPTALALIAEQEEAGKDLARLLSGLIAFFRDVLIATAHPSPLTASLAAVAQEISWEKLLLLLEELEKIEGQFRWASNKKLKLDVGIIRAAHLLEEVSLTEVIEALTALRGGVSLPAHDFKNHFETKSSQNLIHSNSESRASTSEFANVSKGVSTSHADVSNGAGTSQFADAVANCGTDPLAHHDPLAQHNPSMSPGLLEIPPREEPLPSTAATVEQSQAEKETPFFSVTCNLQPDVDPWTPVATMLAAESPLKFGWMAFGKFQEQRDHTVVVEFPPSCEMHTETLFWSQARKKIQEALAATIGEKVELVCSFTGAELPEEPLAEPMIKEELAVERIKAVKKAPSQPAKQKKETPPETTPALTVEELEEFRNDPLIKKALEIFQGELV
ncbi:MAG: DNA polymerase III subunit gamma/tau [Chthoniobacterales bacterium]|nr:DNA polymerase III subunit gamma/tau [Chthoniobacterales bacterium]